MTKESKPLLAPIDKLGLAISDAGYKWTPRMRTAYERSVREHNRLTEKVAVLLETLNETNRQINEAKRTLAGAENLSGKVYMRER